MAGSTPELAICTIAPKMRLAHARVLVDSFHAHHPAGRALVLPLDRVDGCLSPASERFELIELEWLGPGRGRGEPGAGGRIGTAALRAVPTVG